MKSGIFDKNGVEVKEGDTLVFPYVDPMGNICMDVEHFTAVVKFKHGCFGYETQTSFIPLMDWSKIESGEYVPNCGNKKIVLDEYYFTIKQ